MWEKLPRPAPPPLPHQSRFILRAAGQPTKDGSVPPSKQQSRTVLAEKSSTTIPSEATAKKNVTPPAYISKLEAVSKSSRIFRNFHRVHKHASKFVEAVDPYSDVGDYEDGDESMPDDSGNDSGSQSDNGHKNTKSGSGNGTKSAATNTSHHATNNRPVPAAKTTKTGVSVHEPPENKSTSTELTKDAAIPKKEVLTKNGSGRC
jgi:hypothetical protein